MLKSDDNYNKKKDDNYDKKVMIIITKHIKLFFVTGFLKNI